MSKSYVRLISIFAVILLLQLVVLSQKPIPAVKKTAATATTPNLYSEYSEIEKNLLEEINTVRIYPAKYVAFLEDRLKLFKGNISTMPNGISVVTFEGGTPVQEAMIALKALPKRDFFSVSSGLSKAARLQFGDLQQDASLGHFGKNGSNPRTRIAIFGKASEGGENISYVAKSGRETVLDWLIDDGITKRGHRKNVLSPTLTHVGVACGKGKDDANICIAVFGKSFVEYKNPLGTESKK